jgi:hypothetical protein
MWFYLTVAPILFYLAWQLVYFLIVQVRQGPCDIVANETKFGVAPLQRQQGWSTACGHLKAGGVARASEEDGCTLCKRQSCNYLKEA